MTPKRFIILALIAMGSLTPLLAQDSTKTWPEQIWGIGAAVRIATIPFATQGAGDVSSFVPILFYNGKHFFFNGLEGGIIGYRNIHWRLSAVARTHFFDIPEEHQNTIQGDNVDWGVQVRYFPKAGTYLDFEALIDGNLKLSSNVRFGADITSGRLDFRPYTELKIKSSGYNSRYFGLTLLDVDWGVDIALGMTAKLQVWRHFYVFGAAKFTYLDKNARALDLVDRDVLVETFLGAGLANDRSKPRKKSLRTRAYIRVAHGWATPSDLKDILRGKSVPDPYNNQLSSIWYGHPLTDRVFGVPIDLYMTSGFIWHWKSEVQDYSQEVVLAFKADFTIKWPVRWRIGMAEGFSFINKITYIEQQEIDHKEIKASNLLNYLDYTLDISIGDIISYDPLRRLFLGYSLHHRSGIFGAAQQFGRINGGSNYNTLYLLWHL